MKMNMISIILAASFIVCTFAWIANGGDGDSARNHTKAIRHIPNSGYVGDENTALQTGKTVLSYLLAPDDFQKKEFSEARLKDGIWTVRYWESKGRINLSVVIQIRQKTGAIISYEDPNA